jgi:hypothetical protein
MAPSGRRLVWTVCSLALCQAFQLPRSATQPRHPRTAVNADLLDSTLALANAEEFLGGIVGFLPLIAIPGVLVGIPFLVFNRLKDLEGDAYTETVFTDKQPPRRPGAEPVVRKKDIDMSYAELEQKYGEATLFKEDPPPSAAPADAPFALPELPNPFGGGAAPPPKYEAPPSQPEEEFALPELKLPSLPSFPSFGGDASPPKYDDAAPAPPEEEFKLPEISLPSFPNPFGGGAPAAREPVFADEEEDEPAAEEPFKLPEVKFPWQ